MGACSATCQRQFSRPLSPSWRSRSPNQPAGELVEEDEQLPAAKPNLRPSLRRSCCFERYDEDGDALYQDGDGMVTYPREDTLDWLNWLVRDIWPETSQAVFAQIRNVVEPDLQKQLPPPLKGVRFTEFSLGKIAPKFGAVAVRRTRGRRHRGVEIDVDLSWDGRPAITLDIPNLLTFGIEHLYLECQVSIVLRPIMNTMPIVGAIQIWLVSPPKINLKFSGDLVTQLLNFSVLAEKLRGVIGDAIGKVLVLPNKLFYHWLYGREAEVDITSLMWPMPEGMLRLGVIEARGIQGRDWNLLGKATSDPYVIVKVGAITHRTETAWKTVTPQWGNSAWCDFRVFHPRQQVFIEVWDCDCYRPDDFLGKLVVTVSKVLECKDGWFSLTGQDSEKNTHGQFGEIRIRVCAFDFRPTVELAKRPPLPECMAATTNLLTIGLRGLRGLPKENAVGAVMEISVCGQTLKSNPSTYEEMLQDMVYNLNTKEVDPAVQRLAEYLTEHTQHTAEQVADIAGVDRDSLKRLLQQRPSFTTRWHQGFHELVNLNYESQDVLSKASVYLRLHIDGEDDGQELIDIDKPIPLMQLFEQTNMELNMLCSLHRRKKDEVERDKQGELKRKSIVMHAGETTNPGGKPGGKPSQKADSPAQGPFDVDLHLRLWGLDPHSVRTKEVVTPSSTQRE